VKKGTVLFFEKNRTVPFFALTFNTLGFNMTNVLELINVQTFYGNIQALKDINLQVGEGEIITLIGANGAGKSTTLMSISGIVPPRSGEIRFMGKSLADVSPDKIVALGISQVPEGRRIFPWLTVTENLDMGAFLRKDKEGVKKDMAHIFELFHSRGAA